MRAEWAAELEAAAAAALAVVRAVVTVQWAVYQIWCFSGQGMLRQWYRTVEAFFFVTLQLFCSTAGNGTLASALLYFISGLF